MPPHLLASISFHGFGHIGQSAPVINALVRRHPDLRVTLQCAAPLEILRGHFHCAFTHLQHAMDLGVVNQGALRVLPNETARLYADFHADWDARLMRATLQLQALQPDVVFADVPYLSLAAAARAGIPGIAMCSLNWAEIYRFYCGRRPEAPQILAHMHSGYAAAEVFLQPEPSLPMSELTNTQRIGPIARVGRERRAELRRLLGVDSETRLVMVALGGIKTAVTLDTWPRIAGVRWLAQADWNIAHPDALAWDHLGWNYIDVLRSADALITKPGYCSFTEAACNGAPVLYVTYEDWPEQPGLVAWLSQHVPCAAITAEQFAHGTFIDSLKRIMSLPRTALLAPAGVEQAADMIEPYLRT